MNAMAVTTLAASRHRALTQVSNVSVPCLLDRTSLDCYILPHQLALHPYELLSYT
jgi:hypothetical protein